MYIFFQYARDLGSRFLVKGPTTLSFVLFLSFSLSLFLWVVFLFLSTDSLARGKFLLSVALRTRRYRSST